MFNNNSDFYSCGYELILRYGLSDGSMFYIKSIINFSVQTDLNIDELEDQCIEIGQTSILNLLLLSLDTGLLTLQQGYSHIW